MRPLSSDITVALKGVRAVSSEDIAMVCRVRLARNLADERFPEWATEHDRVRVLEKVKKTLQDAESTMVLRPLADFDATQLDMFCEAHIISRDLLKHDMGAGIAYDPNVPFCVMVNEEDHLRIQGFAEGFDMQAAWHSADRLDTRLESQLTYAWSPRLGYLTACPSNVGTGLRASVMLHLLGLRLIGEMDAVMRGLERIRLLVRGIGGEGSEAAGQIYQISNMDTLGVDEATIVQRVTRIACEVIHQERNARIRLVREMPLVLMDCLARALCLLQQARLLSSGEAVEFLSALRLGASLGLVTRLNVRGVDKLIQDVQPGHLQKCFEKPLGCEERDARRADFLRSKLANVKLKG